MPSASDRRLGFPLSRLRVLERDIVAALEVVAEEVSQYTIVRSDEENARRTWTITLATLGAEAVESALSLADSGNLRMVFLLVRSLYEYANKITYYKNNVKEAFTDARQGWTFRERMMEVALSDFVPAVEPLSQETRIKLTGISRIVDAIADRAKAKGNHHGERFKRHYHEGFYAYASAIAHGGPGAINDIVGFEPGEGEHRTQVWYKRRPDKLKVIAHSQIAFQGWLLLFTLTDFSPVAHKVDVAGLLERWKAFDEPLLAFKNAHIAEVGFEQAVLDCLGT